MKKSLVNTLAFLFCIVSYCQDDGFLKLPDIIPPTPEVASLGKYVETPVNEYTGIPRIGIPIYEVNQQRINHSINLSYHAQGVKVEEIASRIGMGWTLNAGGMISRQKRSSPDDMPVYGYLRTNDRVEEFLSTGDVNATNANAFFVANNNHQKDYEPDLFIFSFGGYSGKFFFDQVTNKPIFEEASPLKVEWINYAYFIITTPDGVRYYFGEDKDGTSSTKQFEGGDDAMDIYTTGKYGSSVDETNLPPEYVSTWYLKEVYDPISDESITFDYEEYNLGQLHQRLSSSVLVEYSPARLVSFEHTLSEQNKTEYVLNQINFNNGRIEFIKDPVQRLDLVGSHALKQIDIYSNNEIIKSFGLVNSTVQGSGGSNGSHDLYSFYNGLPDINYRLFLWNVREYAIDKTNNTVLFNDFKEHVFEYSNPGGLPHRFSTAQDFWGFHNGIGGNKNLLPKDYVFGTNGFKELGRADRQINESYAQDGVLTKITYPTGGTAAYTYENNQAKKIAGPMSYYENSLDPIYYSYDIENLNFHEGNADDYYDNNWSSFTYFTLNDFASSTLGATQFIDFNYINYNPGDPSEPYWEVFLQKFDEASNTWPSFNARVLNFQENGPNAIDLDPGQYRIVVNWIGDTNGDNWDLNTHGNADWQISFDAFTQTDLSNEDYILTGGLRVKEIKTNDLKGNINSTTYSYQDENNETTGNLVSLPFRFSGFGFYFYDDQPGTSSTIYVSGRKHSSDTSVPLATSQSSYTGYNKVTKIRENGTNGKTEYNFSFKRNGLDMTTLFAHPNTIGGFAYVIATVPLIDEELQRGKLVSQLEYNSQGDTIRKVTNEYQLTTHNSIDAVSLGYLLSVPVDNFSTVDLGGYGSLSASQGNTAYLVNKYRLFSRTNLMSKSTSSVYDINGENPVTTVTNYFYENDEHLQPTKVVTTNSKGEVITQETDYAHEVNDQRLINEHRIVEPVQTKTLNASAITAETFIDYEDDDGLYLPKVIQAAKDGDDLEDRIIYHQYDDKGNPLEVSKANGPPISYIWGYNRMYPVAKVENATRSQIEASLGVNTDYHTGAEALTPTQETALRGLPNALTTTYSYDPLIGVTSMTDPRGYTIYYEYDEFNRLKAVKDADGNLVTDYEYHYKNQ